jgi:hypothetical protein
MTDHYKITSRTILDKNKKDLEYKSARGVDVNSVEKGTVGPGGAAAKARLVIDFSSRNAIFFRAAECRIKSIDDKLDLGKKIAKSFKQKRWERHNAIVSEIVDGGTTTVVISGEQQARISLEASSKAVQRINLADASLGLRIKSQKIGFTAVTKQKLQPLMGLWGIRSA